MPNCKYFLITEAERKHVRRRARFQQHRDASCHQVFFSCKIRRRRTIEGHFEGKAPREGHQGGPVLARQCPGSPGTCKPRKNWPTWVECLGHPPYSTDLALSDYHLFSGLKKQLKGRHLSSDAEVIATAEAWLDGQPSEFFF